MTNKAILERVKEEVMLAYADCHMGFEQGQKYRKLDFRASSPVSRDEAKAILSEANVFYNAFEPAILDQFHDAVQVVIAREGSVCLYINAPGWLASGLPSGPEVQADERDRQDDGGVRYWWD